MSYRLFCMMPFGTLYKKGFLNEIKLTAGCIDCGTSEELTFDHRDPSEKRFAIGGYLNKAISNLVPEIEKCDIRCAPCHARHHGHGYKVWRKFVGVSDLTRHFAGSRSELASLCGDRGKHVKRGGGSATSVPLTPQPLYGFFSLVSLHAGRPIVHQSSRATSWSCAYPDQVKGVENPLFPSAE